MSLIDTKFELCHDVERVLEIGRNFQKQDAWRGAHHDTVKLLCDTIEHLRDQSNAQIGNAAAMREALEAALKFIGNLEIEPYSPLDEDASELRQRIMDAISAPPRNCDVMSVESAKKLWFVKEIMPRLDGDLPLGKEIPFEEWFVSQQEQGGCDGR